MSTARSNDRQSLCTFTFADGRRCRTPRQSGHPLLCCFHARREAQAQAAEEVGRDIRFFLSGDYLSAVDLSLALGRVFSAAASGQLKPKTAGTLAYLGQTLLQTIHLAENEYINAFSTDSWRRVIHTHIKENRNYLFPPPPLPPAPVPVEAPLLAAATAPAQIAQQLPAQSPSQSPEPQAPVEADLQPGVPHCVSPSAGPNSSQAGPEPVVSNHATAPAERSSSPKEPHSAPSSTTVPPSAQSPALSPTSDPPAVANSSSAPARLPRRAGKLASTVLASARTQTSTAGKPPVPAPKQLRQQVHQACQSWLLFLLALICSPIAPIRLRVARALRPHLLLNLSHHRATRASPPWLALLLLPRQR